MNETDRLRAAIRATEPDGRGRFDVDTIMRQGRRLRRRRRVVRGGAALLSVVVVAVGVAAAVLRQPDPSERGAPPATTSSTAAKVTEPTVGAATPPPAPPPIGTVLSTGIRYGGDERVFYFVEVDVPRAPEVTIGLVAGRRSATGALNVDYLINDVEGSDRRPGFHEIGYEPSAQLLPDDPVPTFGYFVGPATRIIGSVGGQRLKAELATWSEDDDVVVFWFHPQVLRPGQRLDGILAWDAQGRRL
ncbi:hypothetical protein [Micromonospora maris]|uniref:hypothetical protein n=1 Tax=Micromonospora maris TaxID=1003110 RepID=UPI002E108B72|nr:hypothetical protein OG712_23740 [Micromonospora maris]